MQEGESECDYKYKDLQSKKRTSRKAVTRGFDSLLFFFSDLHLSYFCICMPNFFFFMMELKEHRHLFVFEPLCLIESTNFKVPLKKLLFFLKSLSSTPRVNSNCFPEYEASTLSQLI